VEEVAEDAAVEDQVGEETAEVQAAEVPVEEAQAKSEASL